MAAIGTENVLTNFGFLHKLVNSNIVKGYERKE